jgi:hypothetical protein
MLRISKETLAPIYFESLRRAHRANAVGLVPEVVFCLFLCNGVRKSVGIEEIAAQASITYPADFFTWVDGERVPDLALILLTLNEATSRESGYTIGDWASGWHLTRKGLRFAKDVERRKREGRV